MLRLGQTGLKVSPLCFGTLALSPLQGYNDVERGAAVLRYAFEKGVNFLDTAEIYDNYPVIRRALSSFAGDIVVASKSYAYTREQMVQSIEKARRELDRDTIEIFMLHEQESMYTLNGHREALNYLCEAKERGLVRAIGISTHAIAGVRAAASLPEIDVIHPIVNRQGLGIIDGDLAGMLGALEFAAQMGKGIYAMKALGGGHLAESPVDALKFVANIPAVASVAVGMCGEVEVDINWAVLTGTDVPADLLASSLAQRRRLYIADWCEGCGKCVARCPQSALYLKEEQAHVDAAKCVLCGYCGGVCPQFCIKIIKEVI